MPTTVNPQASEVITTPNDAPTHPDSEVNLTGLINEFNEAVSRKQESAASLLKICDSQPSKVMAILRQIAAEGHYDRALWWLVKGLAQFRNTASK